MPFTAPVLTYRAKGLASNIQSKVLKAHNTLINTNITAISAPEMTYTPIFFAKPLKVFPKPVTVFTFCAGKVCYKLANMYYKVCNMCYKVSNMHYKLCNKNFLIGKEKLSC